MTASIAGLHEIADRFDHVLLDQWGTVHEGKAVFRTRLHPRPALSGQARADPINRQAIRRQRGTSTTSVCRRTSDGVLPPAKCFGMVAERTVAPSISSAGAR
jgi:hypothetical protein